MSADPDGHPIRLSLSLPGAASLGAYQAGATAAVAVVVEELRRSGRDVRIDAIGGVSAGAMVALFLAHSLITGSDASRTLHDAWVDDVDATLLRSRSSQAPLDFTQLERRLRHELESPPDDDGGRADLRRQYSPVGLHIGLTNLLGLTYSVETGGSPLSAMSFVDWGRFILDPDDGPRQLVSPEGRSPVDFALASAAHPLAFAPRMLDRSQDRQAYEDNGISNVPESGALWYSDGGLVESAPVGRTLEAAHSVAGPAAGLRMHLVIDPRSSGPSGSSRWGRGDDPPSWLAGVRRAMSVLPSQALHEDLRRIASTNDRLEAIDGVVRAIGDRLDDGDGTLRRQLAAVCRHPVDSEASMPEVLRRTLEDLAGVSGMEQVRIDTISPLLLARESGHPVPGLLAGDIVGAFGGFLSHRLRRSDFALGWASTIAWTRDGFNDFDVDDHVVEHIREVLHERRSESWDEVNAGQWDVSRLDRRARLDLARLAAHVGRIVAMELLPAAVAGRPRRRSRTHGDDGRRS